MRVLNEQENKRIYRGFVRNDVLQACEKIRAILAGIEAETGLNSSQSFDVRVILNELLQNAIKHGSQNGQNKVYMNVWIKNRDTLNITIRDQGSGFDPCKIIQQEQERQVCDIMDLMECGRGLQIVKSLCDDMVFNHRGNCITVRKRLI